MKATILPSVVILMKGRYRPPVSIMAEGVLWPKYCI